MIKHTTPPADDPAAPTGRVGREFLSAEGLRALLCRLHDAGPGAWEHDREAAALMRYTVRKYQPLADKYGLDGWEVASIAFEVMLTASTRRADNPWAVVTRAVQITCGAEVRARGLLCSTDKARRPPRLAGFHDAIRFAERETLTDYHPAFAVNPTADDDDDCAGRVSAALSHTVELFVSQGWPTVLAGDAVAYVAARLAGSSSRAAAIEALRRDHDIPAQLGLPPRSWTALVRIMLGRSSPKHAGTLIGQGILLCLLTGESLDTLREDAALVKAIRAANPSKQATP